MTTFQVENWKDTKEEIKLLASEHAKECDTSRGRAPFDLDDAVYDHLADDDNLLVVTARINGLLAGYNVSVISRHPQFNLRCSFPMGWYVVPDERGIGIELLKEAEKNLKIRDVKIMYESHMVENDISILLKRQGFEPCEIHYTKWIGD